MDSQALIQQSNGFLPSNKQCKISLLCGTSLVFDTFRGRDDSIRLDELSNLFKVYLGVDIFVNKTLNSHVGPKEIHVVQGLFV